MGLVFFLSACSQDGLVSKVDRQITVTPSLVDFGDLPVGAAATSDITLTHVAGGTTTVVDVQLLEVSGGTFTIGDAAGVTVDSTAPGTIAVTWTAEEVGWHEAQLTIFTDEEQDAEHVVELRGHAGEAALVLLPSILDFGPVAVGDAVTEPVTLTNRGDVALDVDGATTDDDHFTAALDARTLGAGDSVNIDVTFTPSDDEAVLGGLSVLVGGGVAATGTLRGNACDGGVATIYDADGDGWTSCGGDCDDTDASVHAGVTEVCDGVDGDCDGVIDETTTCYDDDGDGFSEEEGDCDDSNDDVSPREAENPDNGVDDDCDGVVDNGSDDPDADGFSVLGGDCAEGDAGVHPGAAEVCDGRDQDCDGSVDEGTSCVDDDGDGLSEDAGDCDDTVVTTFPAAAESGNGVDDDCDGVVDEGTDWGDDDGDGWSERGGDCDDTSGSINPGQYDVPSDGIDNDCDGVSA